MNRRKTLQNLMIATVGLVSLPAWAKEWSSNQIVLPTFFTPIEQEILASVVDTIIPEGDNAIGALSVGTDKFLQRLIADCYEPEIQENIKVQLNALNDSALRLYNLPYGACSQFDRQTILLPRSTSNDISQRDFFDLIKGETIRGFRTSKEVMMNYYDYKLAPGHFYGCVAINVV